MDNSSDIEPELLSPAPRRVAPVKGNPYNNAFLRVFMVPFIIVGLMLLGGALLKSSLYLIGNEIKGTIVATRDISDSDGKGFKIDYNYVIDGQILHGSESVSESIYRRSEIGQSIPLKITPLNPSFALLLNEDTSKNIGLVWLFCVIWNAIIYAFIHFAFVLPMVNKRIYQYGKPTTATIVNKTVNSSDDSHTYYIHYRYRTELGELDGRCITHKDLWECCRIGETVTALYLSHKPQKSVLYEFCGYRVMQ